MCLIHLAYLRDNNASECIISVLLDDFGEYFRMLALITLLAQACPQVGVFMIEKNLFDNKKAHWSRFVKANILLQTPTKSPNKFAKIAYYTIKDSCSELLPKKTRNNPTK